MTGYLPNNWLTIAAIAAALCAELIVGFLISRLGTVKLSRVFGWLLVVLSVVAIERLASGEPAGIRMLAIIGALLLGMKVLVSVEERIAGRDRLRPLSWFLFALGWPGMQPSTFADVPGPSKDRRFELLKRGGINLAAGVLLVTSAWAVGSAVSSSFSAEARVLTATLLLLPGISLIFHFGLFNLLAGLWRSAGADCHALFRAPLRSTSLSEFWGRRWNLAFSEMTALIVFRPLKNLVGTRTAMLTAFLFSGVLHELAISVPVKACYGLPFLYFVLHAIAMQVESLLGQRNSTWLANPRTGWWWTLLWLLVPLPILFHPPFLAGCVWPLIGLTAAG